VIQACLVDEVEEASMSLQSVAAVLALFFSPSRVAHADASHPRAGYAGGDGMVGPDSRVSLATGRRPVQDAA